MTAPVRLGLRRLPPPPARASARPPAYDRVTLVLLGSASWALLLLLGVVLTFH